MNSPERALRAIDHQPPDRVLMFEGRLVSWVASLDCQKTLPIAFHVCVYGLVVGQDCFLSRTGYKPDLPSAPAAIREMLYGTPEEVAA